jgi:hypothetical protein
VVKSLPPGDYYAVALTNIEAYEWRDPEFLEGISRDATRFSLADDETKTLRLVLKEER